MTPTPSRGMRILWAASFANLLFLPIWRAILYGTYYRYFAAPLDRQHDALAAMLAVTMTAALVYWLIGRITLGESRLIRTASAAAVFVLTAILLNSFRLVAGLSLHSGLVLATLGAVGAVIAALICWTPRRAGTAVLWMLAVLSPYVAVTFFSATVRVATSTAPSAKALRGNFHPKIVDSAASSPSSPEPPQEAARTRVVWVVLDEWDQSILFERRPAGLRLPNLERLQALAVTMTQAYPPAGTTKESLPGLLTGRIVTEARILDGAKLLFRSESGGQWQDFRECDTVVTDAVACGRSVTLYGWYHPYDQLFPRHSRLEVDSWPLPATEGFGGHGLIGKTVAQVAYLAKLGNRRSLQRELVTEFHDRALHAVANPARDLVFLHYGIPHLPGIYDAVKGRLSSSIASPTEGYLGNLALVDRYIGELLSAAASAGLDGRTNWIFTSDHWWHRAPWAGTVTGHRVPLLIVAAAGRKPMVIDSVICTSALRGMVGDMLQGNLTDNTAVAVRMAGEKTVIPTHYRANAIDTEN